MSDCTCAEWGICHNCYDEKCDEVKKLEEENKRLLVLLEKCWHDFTEIEHVAGIAPNKELYNAIWKEIK